MPPLIPTLHNTCGCCTHAFTEVSLVKHCMRYVDMHKVIHLFHISLILLPKYFQTLRLQLRKYSKQNKLVLPKIYFITFILKNFYDFKYILKNEGDSNVCRRMNSMLKSFLLLYFLHHRMHRVMRRTVNEGSIFKIVPQLKCTIL